MAGNSNHIRRVGRYKEAHGRGGRPDNRLRGIFLQQGQQGEQHFATLLRGTKLPLPDERIELGRVVEVGRYESWCNPHNPTDDLPRPEVSPALSWIDPDPEQVKAFEDEIREREQGAGEILLVYWHAEFLCVPRWISRKEVTNCGVHQSDFLSRANAPTGGGQTSGAHNIDHHLCGL